MLSSQFDYSDEEDSDGETKKKQEEPVVISHDSIIEWVSFYHHFWILWLRMKILKFKIGDNNNILPRIFLG